jgi:hypothetical protein
MLRNCNASPDKLSTAQNVLQRLEKGKQTIAGDLAYYLSALSQLVEETKLSRYVILQSFSKLMLRSL